MRRCVLAAVALCDAAALLELRPHRALLRQLAAPHAWLAEQGADRATAELASAALWLVAAWLAVGLVALCCARLPGVVGRWAQAIAAAVLPRAVYRLAAGAAGLGVVLAPGLANASPAPSPAPAASAVAAVLSCAAPAAPAASAVPSSAAPSWPTDGAPRPPAWPTTSRPVATPTRATPARSTPTTAATAEGTARAHPATPGRDAAHPVVVEPGDSLWRIAAAHLPASAPTRRVAAAWPRWYAANRRVIGDDPSHITPGQLLKIPFVAAEEGPQ